MGLIDKTAYDNEQVSSGGGEYGRMTAGGYVCCIQAVRTRGTNSSGRAIDYVKEKDYVILIYDVIEGEFAGKFSDDYWADESKDWGHRAYFSWKNLGAFKRNVQCFDESNPGFDCFAAVDAEQWGLLIGKKIGLVFGEEEYIANDGSVKTRFTFPTYKSVQDIRAGKFKVPPLKKLPEDERPKQAEAYDDVPF